MQSQAAALPRHQEEEETDKTTKRKSNKRTKSAKIISLFPKRGLRKRSNRNAERTDKIQEQKNTRPDLKQIAS